MSPATGLEVESPSPDSSVSISDSKNGFQAKDNALEIASAIFPYSSIASGPL